MQKAVASTFATAKVLLFFEIHKFLRWFLQNNFILQEKWAKMSGNAVYKTGKLPRKMRLNIGEDGGGFFGRTDLLRHGIHSDAVRAGNMFFMRVIVPRRKDENTTGGNGIEEGV